MTRTASQQRAIEVYCRIIAEQLNNTDKSVQEVCKLPISWTQDNFKQNIFKPVMIAMFPDIKSTTQLSKIQVNEVYEEVNRLMGSWGVGADFPHEEK